ncbi:MAG: hypothetical protein NXI17_08985 [Alphaproteobacteria bacterium]|nr:hypothetical protein [Alphaproteobacteria bacterium]
MRNQLIINLFGGHYLQKEHFEINGIFLRLVTAPWYPMTPNRFSLMLKTCSEDHCEQNGFLTLKPFSGSDVYGVFEYTLDAR